MADEARRRKPISKEDALRRVMSDPFGPPPVLARVLGVSDPAIYRAIKEGSIPAVRVGSKLRIAFPPYRAMIEAGVSAAQVAEAA